MLKNRSLLSRVATILVAIAPIMAFDVGCAVILGEPQLPEKFTK